MGKNSFDFKEFTVYQDKCGMKVCTDSCLFGALVETNGAKTLLDVGTGTGLLSLMLAQRTASTIIAIEPDEEAFFQAQDNVHRAPFRNIKVSQHSLQNISSLYNSIFDVIVCNPPFYSNYLKSNDKKYNSSVHSSSLPFSDIISCVLTLLTDQGSFWLLLPIYEFDSFQKLGRTEKLHLNRKFTVYDRPDTKPIRNIGVFSKYESFVTSEDLFIKNENKVYSEHFKALLSPYYKIF